MPSFLSPTEFLTHLVMAAAVATTPVIDSELQVFLNEGNFSEAVIHYQAKDPADDSDRLALALTFTLEAVAGLAQDNYRFGLGNQAFADRLPFLRLPVPPSPNPEVVQAKDLRAMLLHFQEKIYQANQALADFHGATDFKIVLDLHTITLPLDDQKTIKLSEIYQNLTGRNDLADLTLHLDAADGFWLKAYTHLLLAMSDFLLALDGRPVFDLIAPQLFPQAKTTWTSSAFYQPAWEKSRDLGFNSPEVIDLLASASQFRFVVSEPKRLQNVPLQLLAMIQNSRLMLQALQQENDDDREWLPNPRQTSALGAAVSVEQYQAWEAILKESEALLTGKKLIGHWRVEAKYGFNLALFFAQPPTVLDPFLLYQGKAALPYLQEGQRSQIQTWQDLLNVFEGNFFGFALWIN